MYVCMYVCMYGHHMFGVLGPRCWTAGSSMLDYHVLKGFGIYMIGVLGSLSDVVLHVCSLLV